MKLTIEYCKVFKFNFMLIIVVQVFATDSTNNRLHVNYTHEIKHLYIQILVTFIQTNFYMSFKSFNVSLI